MKLSITTELIKKTMPLIWQRWAAFTILWTTVGFISAVHWWYFPSGMYPYTWLQLLSIKLAIWFSWGFTTVVILYIANRFPLSRPWSIPNILIVTALSVIVTGFYLVLYVLLLHLGISGSLQLEKFNDMFYFVMTRHSTFYFLSFWATVILENGLIFYNRYHEQKLEQTALQTKLAQAQLQTLRSQLQPHFLFNTLNTISSMVINEETESANDLLVRLSDLLRFNLDHADKPMVKLSDELRFIDSYLALMQTRFKDNLSIEKQVDDSALEHLVPSMILQPLIENSVKYSATSSGEFGIIKLSIEKNNKQIKITIKNNLSSQHMIKSGTGVGFLNTRRRIQAIYGENALLDFHISDQWATVDLSFPSELKSFIGSTSLD